MTHSKDRAACVGTDLQIVFSVAFVVLAALAGQPNTLQAQAAATQEQYLTLAGNYRLPDGDIVGITLFPDGATPALLYSNYGTGVLRRLFPVEDGAFGAGPGFAIPSPIELMVRFTRDRSTAVTGALLQQPNQPEVLATRIGLTSHDVTFASGDATLSGTLITPTTPGPHPAIILLHGSGRLTRFSFGPYPHFFTSLGLSVLIYDKRGTGASTGRFFDRTTLYPHVFVQDALAAVRFLASRADIDARRIGIWGISEGGMLSTQVAAASNQVAFIINSGGFMLPLWEQVLYNIEAQLRADGLSPRDVADAVTFQRLATGTMRTGDGWEQFSAAQADARRTKWYAQYFGDSAGFSSLDSLRRQWEYVYKFDPRIALGSVRCPVLGLFGELDTATPPEVSLRNMREGLTGGGNRDVTLRLVPKANHPLMEARTGGNIEVPTLRRMAPEVFPTLRAWILNQIGAKPSN